jgi:hypothetical protein
MDTLKVKIHIHSYTTDYTPWIRECGFLSHHNYIGGHGTYNANKLSATINVYM